MVFVSLGRLGVLSKQLIEEMWFAVSTPRCRGGVGACSQQEIGGVLPMQQHPPIFLSYANKDAVLAV